MDADDLSEDKRADFEERAAILEFDAKMPREQAEKIALGIILNEL